MKLIYTTNDLEAAQKLASALEAADVPVHLAGENVARTPGVNRWASDLLGVWVIDESKMTRALGVMSELELLPTPSSKKLLPPSFWIKVAIVIAIAATIIVMAN